MMQGPKNPLADLGAPHVRVGGATPFEVAGLKMEQSWGLLFAERARVCLPATVTSHLQAFSGKTPASGRPSISATFFDL